MLMFGWDFEVVAWSRFRRWNLVNICVRACDMTLRSYFGKQNSTLVVPFAMYDKEDPLGLNMYYNCIIWNALMITDQRRPPFLTIMDKTVTAMELLSLIRGNIPYHDHCCLPLPVKQPTGNRRPLALKPGFSKGQFRIYVFKGQTVDKYIKHLFGYGSNFHKNHHEGIWMSSQLHYQY